jgi:hypothetical protein
MLLVTPTCNCYMNSVYFQISLTGKVALSSVLLLEAVVTYYDRCREYPGKRRR